MCIFVKHRGAGHSEAHETSKRNDVVLYTLCRHAVVTIWVSNDPCTVRQAKPSMRVLDEFAGLVIRNAFEAVACWVPQAGIAPM